LPEPLAQDIPLTVVYEDDELLVVDKPAGMVVHPAPGNYQDTLVNALLGRRTQLSASSGRERPGIVHRLDKETSGLLIVAKNQEAHHRLAAQLAAKDMKRTYLAVVWGRPDREGRIEAPVGRSAFDRKRMAVTLLGGRRAATRWRVLENFGRVAAMIQLELETGRTHQIRVHCEHMGHPIVGDPTYNKGRREVLQTLSGDEARLAKAIDGMMERQALHARSLKFRHPRSGKPMELTSDPPPDFQSLVDLLRSESRFGKSVFS